MMHHGLLYLAGMTAFLFGFFFFGSYTDDYPSMVYLQYTCLAAVFYIVVMAFFEYTNSRPKKKTGSELQEERRNKWLDQKKARRERRRW